MTIALPKLLQVPSPNWSERNPPKIDLIIWHRCEGSYEGSISWFAQKQSQVSAHLVMKEDGTEATQMVPFSKKAWHCCSFNSRSIGLEMGGYGKDGSSEIELQTAANIIAWLLHKFGIPCQWSKHGVGPGFTSHYDLGAEGGGHSDPTTDPAILAAFVTRVEASYKAMIGVPLAQWGYTAATPTALVSAPPAAPPDYVPTTDVRSDEIA